MIRANYEQIKKKISDLSDLISREVAAYIVANELGVKILEDFSKKTLKINQLIPGMTSVNIVGKIIQVYSVREFDNGTRQGKIGSLLLGDETGTIRVVMWDTNHIKDLNENENATISGTVVQIFEPRFYEACSQSNKKVNLDGKCELHQNADTVKQPILNLS